MSKWLVTTLTWGILLLLLLSSALTAVSTRQEQIDAVDTANAALIEDTQRSVDIKAEQIQKIIQITQKYKSDYQSFVQANDKTLYMSDSQIHAIAWSGGTPPTLSNSLASQANTLSEQFLAMEKFCIDAVSQDLKTRYPSYIHKTNHYVQECQ